MAKQLNTYQPPTREEIAACAHRIYEMEGRPEGRALEHWLQSEAQLIADRKAQAAEKSSKPAAIVAPAAARSAKRERSTKPPISRRTRSILPISTRPKSAAGRI